MARWMASTEMQQSFHSKTILELGAGCGLPGLAAAHYRCVRLLMCFVVLCTIERLFSLPIPTIIQLCIQSIRYRLESDYCREFAIQCQSQLWRQDASTTRQACHLHNHWLERWIDLAQGKDGLCHWIRFDLSRIHCSIIEKGSVGIVEAKYGAFSLCSARYWTRWTRRLYRVHQEWGVYLAKCQGGTRIIPCQSIDEWRWRGLLFAFQWARVVDVHALRVSCC